MRLRKQEERSKRTLSPWIWTCVAVALLSGCRVGPNYQRPTVPTPPAFEGVAPASPPNPPNGGWKEAAPADSAIRGNWWEMYGDSQLNQLEEKVAVSNQTLRAAYEQYMQAREAVQVARSQYYPTLSLGPTVSRDRESQHRPLLAPGTETTYNDLVLGGQATWEPDVWGAIRRTVEEQRATAQASAADLANAQLSLQAELAMDSPVVVVIVAQLRIAWRPRRCSRPGRASTLPVIGATIAIGRIAMAGQYNLHAHFAGALHEGVEVIHLDRSRTPLP